MRRNVGARGPPMNTGSGLLGEGPAIGAGMKRMMAGIGNAGSLLGSWPSDGMMQQHPRSLLDRHESQGGMTEQRNRGEELERPAMRDRSPYGGGMKQSSELGYYDERGDSNRYMEEQAVYQQESNNQGASNYEQQKEYGQEHYENSEMHFDYNHGSKSSQEVDAYRESDYNQRDLKQRRDLYEDPNSNQRGLLGERPARGGKVEKPQRLFDELVRQGMEDQYDQRGNQEQPREPRSLQGMPHEERDMISMEHHDYIQQAHQRGVVDLPREQRGHMNSSMEQRSHMDSLREQRDLMELPREKHGHMDSLMKPQREQRGRIDLSRDQRGLMESPREQHGFMDMQREQRGLMEPPREHHGLMELPEPPRPPMGLMDSSREPRNLMDTQMNQRGLMDPSRDVRDQRGILDTPRDQRGLFDVPREQRGLLDSPRQQKGMNKRGKQNELMEKADLQMKLLQQEKLREHDQMEQINLLQQQQQAILMQQQQQQMQQQIQQQIQVKMEEQEEIKQQMQQAELIMAGNQGSRGGGGSIPSLFDLPARGKRPAPPSRISDNKRPRTMSADRRDRRPPSVPERRRSPINRSIERQRDRNRRTRFSSPAKKQDRKDSGSARNATSKPAATSKDRSVKGRVREEKGKSRDESNKPKDEKEKSKDEKGKDREQSKTEVIVIMDEEYDPAEPTEDEVVTETGGAQDEAVEKIEKGETEIEIGDKLDDSNLNEISLTVTVNKKGRSVNDADMKDSEKTGKRQMYKCNVCTIECFDEESFHRHMSGKKHSEKMKIVMSSTAQPGILNSSVMIKSRQQAEEHLRQIEGRKVANSKRVVNGPTGQLSPKGKVLESHCKVCEKKFTGAYKFHKETPEHKAREDRSKAGCKVCKVTSFKSYQDFVNHLRSNWHLKKMKQDSWPECKLCKQKFKSPRKFVQHCKTDHHIQNKRKSSNDNDEDELGDLVTLDTIGFEDDANVDKTVKDTEKEKFTAPAPVGSIAVATSTPKTDSKPMNIKCITPVKPEEESVVPEIYDSSVAVGQRYVVSVSGYFCKLCHKFYNNEIAAKISHCQSQTHYEKLKKTLASKRAKADVSSKKSETSQPLFKTGEESEENNEEASQKENLVETGNQSMNESAGDKSINDTTNIEETSQYETADEHQDSTVNVGNQDQEEDGNETMEAEDGTGNDVESGDGSQGSPDEDVDDTGDTSKTVIAAKKLPTKHVQSTRGKRGRKI